MTPAEAEAFRRWRLAQQGSPGEQAMSTVGQAGSGLGAAGGAAGGVGLALGALGTLAPFLHDPRGELEGARDANKAVLAAALRRQQQQVMGRASLQRGNPILALRNAEQVNEQQSMDTRGQIAAQDQQFRLAMASANEDRLKRGFEGLTKLGSSLSYGAGLAMANEGSSGSPPAASQQPLQVAPSQQPYRGGIGPGMGQYGTQAAMTQQDPNGAAAYQAALSQQPTAAPKTQQVPQPPAQDIPQNMQMMRGGLGSGDTATGPWVPGPVTPHPTFQAIPQSMQIPGVVPGSVKDPQDVANQYATNMPEIGYARPFQGLGGVVDTGSMAQGDQNMLMQDAARGQPQQAGQMSMRQGPMSSYAPQPTGQVNPNSASGIAQRLRRRRGVNTQQIIGSAGQVMDTLPYFQSRLGGY